MTNKESKCPLRVIRIAKGDSLRVCRWGNCTHTLQPEEDFCPCHQLKESWEEEFDKLWDIMFRMGGGLRHTVQHRDIKNFISNLLSQEREKQRREIIEEIDEELRKLPKVVVNLLSQTKDKEGHE